MTKDNWGQSLEIGNTVTYVDGKTRKLTYGRIHAIRGDRVAIQLPEVDGSKAGATSNGRTIVMKPSVEVIKEPYFVKRQFGQSSFPEDSLGSYSDPLDSNIEPNFPEETYPADDSDMLEVDPLELDSPYGDMESPDDCNGSDGIALGL